jgi:hypothetical protein
MDRINFAFIDGQNLNLGILRIGWKLDLKRFRMAGREKIQFLNDLRKKLEFQKEKALL